MKLRCRIGYRKGNSGNDIILFFFMTTIPLSVYCYHVFFIHFAIDGHVMMDMSWCFHVLVIAKSPAVNILSEVNQTQKIKYHDITYMWNLKKGYKWLNYKAEVSSQMQKTNWWLPGNQGEKDKFRDCDWHVHTTLYKIDK